MDEHLGKDSAMVILAALALASIAGLAAWGPMPLGPDAHHYADSRTMLGVPNALNVLVSLPCMAISAWGWRAMRRSPLPADLQRTWTWFQVLGLSTSVAAAAYHLRPNDAMQVASRLLMTGAFTMLTFAFLAERVSLWFATPAARAVALAAPAAMLALVVAGSLSGGVIDLRPLRWLELLPILLVPTGALGLRGTHTTRCDWMVALGLYGAARLVDAADPRLFEATGWISGHTLMHLCLGAVTGWAAYCTTRPVAPDAAAVVSSQPRTALNTAG